MNTTKKPHQTATLTYEQALAPIAENIYQWRAYERRARAFSESGDERLAKDMQDLADVHWVKVEALADFSAHLFGVYLYEVVGDASERANAIYEERRKNG